MLDIWSQNVSRGRQKPEWEGVMNCPVSYNLPLYHLGFPSPSLHSGVAWIFCIFYVPPPHDGPHVTKADGLSSVRLHYGTPMLVAHLSCGILSRWHYYKIQLSIIRRLMHPLLSCFICRGGNDPLWKLMAGVIFQKVTLRLAQRLFSTDLYLFKGGLWLSAVTNALTNSWAPCHLEFI